MHPFVHLQVSPRYVANPVLMILFFPHFVILVANDQRMRKARHSLFRQINTTMPPRIVTDQSVHGSCGIHLFGVSVETLA